MSNGETRVVVHLDDGTDATFIDEKAKSLALRPDTEVVRELAVEPGTVLAFVGATYAVSHLVLSIIDRWRGGMMLDLAAKPRSIRRDRSVPLGIFLVVGTNGEVKIETKELPRDGLERIVEKLFSLGKTPTKEAINDAVKSSSKQ